MPWHRPWPASATRPEAWGGPAARPLAPKAAAGAPSRPEGLRYRAAPWHRRRELTPSELSELGPSALCERAGREVASLLPTVRTCRMLPEACAEAVASWQNSTCPLVFEPLTRGASMGQMMSAQQAACGRLLTQRPGSGVHEAEVCPALRDIGGRIMSIAGLVAAALFAAQLNHF